MRRQSRLKWPTTPEEIARIRRLQKENVDVAKRNPNEIWMREKLRGTGLKWSPQSRWGFRIFDFWCHKLGIAVEVDGPEHRATWDSFRDEENLRVDAIMVLRVLNRNEGDAATALAYIKSSPSWNDRRRSMGLKPLRGGDL